MSEIIFLFDEKDYEAKVKSLGVKVVETETVQMPTAVIAVHFDNKVELTPINLWEESRNYSRYIGKRKAAVSRRERRKQNQ